MPSSESSVIPLKEIKRVAVIDDDADAAMSIKITLEDAGYEVVLIERADDVAELLQSIVSSADAAVCDHRLSFGAFANISGAEIAARLVDLHVPAVLVTQFFNQDADITIRKHRKHLPVVLRRSEAGEPDELRAAIETCQREMAGVLESVRKPQTTLLKIMYIQPLSNGEFAIDAVVHGVYDQDAVRFPCSLVPEELRSKLQPGVVLKVQANLRAADPKDYFFDNFEVVQEPDENDGLA